MKQYKLRPYVLGLRTTERCNVGCYNCSISATPKGEDMSLGMGLKAIEEASKYGIKLLHLSGGEPLLYNNLIAFAKKGKECNMEIEIVTSTYTNEKEDNLLILEQLKENGLQTVMISYDDAHARRISQNHFIRFLKKSIMLDLSICIFVTETAVSKINVKEIQNICKKNDIDTSNIDWISAIYQFAGRGKSKHLQSIEDTNDYTRCPYVMPVPTLRPNGDFLLCPCSVLNTKNFIVGDFNQIPLRKIFDNLHKNNMYRYLAKVGPQQALNKLEIDTAIIPNDMCQACEMYLHTLEKQEYFNKYVKLIESESLEDMIIDYNALLIPHKSFLIKYFKS